MCVGLPFPRLVQKHASSSLLASTASSCPLPSAADCSFVCPVVPHSRHNSPPPPPPPRSIPKAISHGDQGVLAICTVVRHKSLSRGFQTAKRSNPFPLASTSDFGFHQQQARLGDV